MPRRASLWILLVLASVPSSCGERAPFGSPVEDGGVDAGTAPDGGSVADAGSAPDGGVPGDGGAWDILAQLGTVPGLTVSEQFSNTWTYRIFFLAFSQPVEHDKPLGPRFEQRAILLHRDASRPMVLASTGYDLYLPYGDVFEPTALLDANQLVLEHRYFADSTPTPTDWSHLTIREQAEDAHAVVAALKGLYPGPWLATGPSKGGMTSVYHARFHPEDLAGVVAYVAPISFGAPDPRYLPFFTTVGDATCRQAARDYQRAVLLRRPAMETRLHGYAATYGVTFNLLGWTGAIESAAAEWEWSFWQYAGPAWCDQIPPAGSGDDALFGALDLAYSLYFTSDAMFAEFLPYYVQADSELGYPAEDLSHLADLLPDAGVRWLPPGAAPTYQPSAMQDIDHWVQTEGNRLLFVYGSTDPWSAGAFQLGGATDSFRLFAAGLNHDAEISDLSAADRALAYDALGRWTGVTPGVPHGLRANGDGRPGTRPISRHEPHPRPR